MQFLNNYRSLDNDLRAATAGQRGRVRIASVPSVAAKLIPSVLGIFCEKYPNVEVCLIDDNAAGLSARQLTGVVDLALGNNSNIEDSATDITPLVTDPIGVVYLRDTPIASQPEGIEWNILLNQPFIKMEHLRYKIQHPRMCLANERFTR